MTSAERRVRWGRLNAAVGRTVQAARKRRGWNQAELGRRFTDPLSYTVVSYLETGATQITMGTLEELGRIFECSPLDFIPPNWDEVEVCGECGRPL